MTTIVHLTHAELRKLVAARTFLIGLALAVGVAVLSVVVDAAVAGKNGTPALGTTASTDQMLKLGSVCCVAMLVLGIIGAGSEYRHKTIVSAVLVAPRRGALVAAKVIGITVASLAPHLAKWLVTGAASTLTDPGVLASRALTPATAVAVLGAYTVILVAIASRLVLRRDVA